VNEGIQVQVTLRERNQLTLPDRVAARMEAKPGDRLLVTVEPAKPGEPGVVRLKRLRDSYAGIAAGVYGRTAEEHAAYIAAERDSWERDPEVPSAAAPDGTPYLTFEQSRRTYWQTDVTRERYEHDAKLRWPKCEICGRSIARMREHLAAHQEGTLDERGVNTDPRQRARSRRRVAKWRASLARKAR
jgi:bifunctional DNA-binding transcriptional regulator/antitoxin component of YhaV-PrlF toxin-antitoxin module